MVFMLYRAFKPLLALLGLVVLLGWMSGSDLNVLVGSMIDTVVPTIKTIYAKVLSLADQAFKGVMNAV